MPPKSIVSNLLAMLTLTACGVSAEPDAPYHLPRLPDGPHMGIIVGFEDLRGGSFDRVARTEDLLDAAAEAGASISRVQVDWADLEPRPGRYNAGDLADALGAARTRGQHVFVTLSTLDSEGFTIPADLMGEDGLLRGGLTMASPEVTDRFEAFLDWFVPRLSAADVWGLALGNEVDAPINDHFATEDGALVFYQSAAARVQQLDPDMGVTVTLTMGAPQTLPAFTRDLMSSLTLATFNHYCLSGLITVTGPKEWDRDVALMKRTAGDLPIMIQELGCPVGFSETGGDRPQGPEDVLASSLDLQDDHIAYFRDLYLKDPQFRGATLFQLYDWSEDLTALFSDILRAEGMPVVAERFDAWLRTVGYCRWETGVCGPAWDTWLGALAKYSAARDTR